MKIVVFAAGSRGDIQPCVALARGLQQAGYEVCLAAPKDFADFAAAHAVGFYGLRGDVQQIMASDTGREFMETSGANPLKSIRAMRTLLAPVVLGMAEDLEAACCGADGLVCLGVFSPFGRAVAEALGIPLLSVEPTPLLPTRAFPAPSWPIQRNLGRFHNYVSGVAMLGSVWLWYRPFVAEVRRRLKLPQISAVRAYRDLRATPMLGAYSPTVIPHPSDWPQSLHVTGYLFLDDSPAWHPPPELEAFLEAGKPPVYIGFGSMAGRDPERRVALVLQALERSGQRGVLLTGWGGLSAHAVPEDVFVLDSAPHSWLFPRMAAVVHHGGAGTTAEGLRAGVPQLVLPFILDQPFWGARVTKLGVGPAPIPQKQLTAERLARAISAAVAEPGMKHRAAECGAAIRAEDGVGNAVKVVERYFGAPSAARESDKRR